MRRTASSAMPNAPDLAPNSPVPLVVDANSKRLSNGSFVFFAVVRLQVSAQRLLTFNRFKERLDISATEAARAFALNNLHERSRARVQRFGEDLKHRAPLVLIDENTQLTKRLLLDVVQFPYALFHRLVVGVGSIEKLDAIGAQRADGPHNVTREQRDVLCARTVMKLQVLFNLRRAFARRRFHDGKLDAAVTALHHA